MFTGIIQALGKVVDVTPLAGDVRLRIRSDSLDWDGTKIGDSVAVNGVCLTAIDLDQQSFLADVSNETLSKTSLAKVTQGSRVNLETALALGDAMGGHLVSGHVDGLALLRSKQTEGRSVRYVFRAPEELTRYVAAKGSVCLDGVSLTVNTIVDRDFDVNIIPHTQQQTIFQDYAVGSQVNLEVDMIARYLERLMSVTMHSPLNEEYLKKAGFGKTD